MVMGMLGVIENGDGHAGSNWELVMGMLGVIENGDGHAGSN